MILAGAPWFSVESWPLGLWFVPCSSRRQARECCADARAEGTHAWVMRAGDSTRVAVRRKRAKPAQQGKP